MGSPGGGEVSGECNICGEMGCVESNHPRHEPEPQLDYITVTKSEITSLIAKLQATATATATAVPMNSLLDGRGE